MLLNNKAKKLLKATLCGAMLTAFATFSTVNAETLRGASMFDDKHTFTKTMEKFGELVETYYDGDIKFDLRLNGELGVEKDYVTFLNQGVAIDYTILAPSNMARFAPSIPLMDMPFLFRDLDHWNAVLSSDILAPLEKELLDKADIVIVGYAGGGTRNLISSKKISNLEELAGHKMRVMGAPIQAQVFDAIGAAPSAIAYNEVYNAIQTGVVNPIVFSGKSFRKLPEKLQAAIKKAGKEAGAYGRELESREDGEKLKQMADAGQIKVSEFEGREKLLDMVKPVQDKFAENIKAVELLKAIRTK